MIQIKIRVEDGKVYDHLNDVECSLEEIGVALLRLKQIEQILIDKNFQSDFEVREDE